MKIQKIYFLILLFFFLTCKKRENKEINEYFEKSYKGILQNEDSKNLEHIDSVSNVYSNFKYNFSYKYPKGWSYDHGASKHTVFRSYHLDSSINFSVNVIEVKLKKDYNIWEMYQNNPKQFNKVLKQLEKQLNTEINHYGLKVHSL